MKFFSNAYSRINTWQLRLKVVPRWVWITSVGLSFALIIAQYFQGNCPYPLFDNTWALTLSSFFDRGERYEDEQDLMAINVGKEKAIAYQADEFGDTIGSIAITNRYVLAELLNFIRSTNYRYVFLDVRMEDSISTPYDSLLFQTINSMPRLIVSRHSVETGFQLNSGINEDKTAMADYSSAVTEGFSRYQYIQPEGESVAHVLYRNLIGDSIVDRGPLYFDSNHGLLCNNLAFIPLPVVIKDKYGSMGVSRYRYLRTEFRLNYTPDELRQYMTGKIIVIGDFDNDVHNTYIGDKVPGPMIHYYAFKALENMRHVVNLWVTLISFILYFLILLALLTPSECKVLNRRHHKVLRFLGALFGWNALLIFSKLLCYICFGVSVHTLLPSLLFSGIVLWRSIRREILEKRPIQNIIST
ncbi:MAG: CHASE2 domain-containing protein [Paramuribaculum sp.]|nr:CHASE2 domain-containing protein [Paramuribaculum sp.]